VPVTVGQDSSPFTWSWSLAGPEELGQSEGRGSSLPTCSWGSEGPEGCWAGGSMYPSELWDRLWAGVRPGGGDPSGLGYGGMAEGQVSQHGVGPV
jgi:hypothetical protein